MEKPAHGSNLFNESPHEKNPCLKEDSSKAKKDPPKNPVEIPAALPKLKNAVAKPAALRNEKYKRRHGKRKRESVTPQFSNKLKTVDTHKILAETRAKYGKISVKILLISSFQMCFVLGRTHQTNAKTEAKRGVSIRFLQCKFRKRTTFGIFESLQKYAGFDNVSTEFHSSAATFIFALRRWHY